MTSPSAVDYRQLKPSLYDPFIEMLPRISVVISFLVFLISLTIPASYFWNQSRYLRMEEWKLIQDWKIVGIASRFSRTLESCVPPVRPLRGEIQITDRKVAGFSLEDQECLNQLRSTASNFKAEIGYNSILKIKWHPLQSPDPNLPPSPLLEPTVIRIDTTLENSRLGNESVIGFTTHILQSPEVLKL